MEHRSGRRPMIGVMGAGRDARPEDIANAHRLGELIAREDWVLLSGGRDAGVMRAANQGAKQIQGSLTVGILPSASAAISPDVDIAIITDMGSARNNINVLSSHVIVACGATGPGTVSEIALALKAGKPVVLLESDPAASAFFQGLGGSQIRLADTPESVIEAVRQLLRAAD